MLGGALVWSGIASLEPHHQCSVHAWPSRLPLVLEGSEEPGALMRRDVEVLRRWFPEANIVEPPNWLPHARIPGGIQVEVLFHDHAPAALIVSHRRPDGSVCEGIVRIRPTYDNREVWDVEQEEPLTLSPSITCVRCGYHGWIRDGRWWVTW